MNLWGFLYFLKLLVISTFIVEYHIVWFGRLSSGTDSSSKIPHNWTNAKFWTFKFEKMLYLPSYTILPMQIPFYQLPKWFQVWWGPWLFSIFYKDLVASLVMLCFLVFVFYFHQPQENPTFSVRNNHLSDCPGQPMWLRDKWKCIISCPTDNHNSTHTNLSLQYNYIP